MRRVELIGGFIVVAAFGGMATAQHSVSSTVSAGPRPSTQDTETQPIGDPRLAFSVDDYPPAALRNKEQGRVTVSLDVDATGRPTRCTVTTSSGFASLDEVTCSVAMQKARFTPATRNGKSVAGVFSPLSITWAIPDGGPQLQARETLAMTDHEVEFALNTRGEVTSCVVIRRGPGGSDPCKSTPIGSPMTDAPQRNGQPVTSKVRLAVRMTITAD